MGSPNSAFVEIDVSQADIDQAKANQQRTDYDPVTQCMVAVSLNRTTGLQWNVGTNLAWTQPRFGVMLTYRLSDATEIGIEQFVYREKVAPFSATGFLQRFFVQGLDREHFEAEVLKTFPKALITSDTIIIAGVSFSIEKGVSDYNVFRRQVP